MVRKSFDFCLGYFVRVPSCPLHPRKVEAYLLTIAACSVWMTEGDGYSPNRVPNSKWASEHRALFGGFKNIPQNWAPKSKRTHNGVQKGSPKKEPKDQLPYADYNRSSAGLDCRRAAVVLRWRLYCDWMLLAAVRA